MPLLREDLLNPLPHPPGPDLKGTSVYDEIEEARREDADDGPREHWKRPLKKADHASVIKLAGEALATQSKDLELATWLAEALICTQGTAALPECIQLLHGLHAQFWDILYPQLDEGSPVFRLTLLSRFSAHCDALFRKLPLIPGGINWYQYKAYKAKTIPYEKDIKEDDDSKLKIREQAVKEGKLLPEQFENLFGRTPKDRFVASAAHLQTTQEMIAALEVLCGEKYGNESPIFSRLNSVIAEIKQVVDLLLRNKQDAEPQPVAAPQPASPASEDSPQPAAAPASAPSVPSLPLEPKPFAALPSGPEDAIAGASRIAEYLRKADPHSVVPYLLVRSLRWGELRSTGDSPDPDWLVPPATGLRQELKRLYKAEKWQELLAAAESAAASPCGRSWLDLHRYSWQSCREQNYEAAARAICSELKALLTDFPGLPEWKFNDDTAVASKETKEWLQQHVTPPASPSAPVMVPVQVERAAPSPPLETEIADPFKLALQLAQSGRLQEGIEVLSRNSLHDDSGREKFLRQLHIARLCLTTGRPAIAYPILQELFAEIQRRELLGWESKGFIVQPLALLVQCLDKTSQDAQQRSQVYNLLCRLEPGVALQLQSS